MQWQNIKKYLYDLDYIASDELAMSIHIASSQAHMPHDH